jgi:Kef-type K+ transport system membrane component KefB
LSSALSSAATGSNTRSGLLQSTNLSFIVVTVGVGTELGRLREINATALILAGLVSALLLPTIAAMLLGSNTEESVERHQSRELSVLR